MLSSEQLEEMAHIRAGLMATRGKLGTLQRGTPEFDRLSAYRMRLHMRRAAIMSGEPTDSALKPAHVKIFSNPTEDIYKPSKKAKA